MQILEWQSLNEAARHATLARPAQRELQQTQSSVREIIAAVRNRGDAAVLEYTSRFDAVDLDALEVGANEIQSAQRALTPVQLAAIDTAIGTIRAFHSAQLAAPLRVETAPGVICERIVRPIRAVGLYVPAGSAPLPSTALMLAVPAAIAGCQERILCTPPGPDGRADAAVLVAAGKAGITRIFKCGGAQAVAAMAYGTSSIPKCDKIFGPGNAWVTEAKLQVANDPNGAAFDLPAGVSEVMVIADATANPGFVAADLLAQAEHGADAQALLVTDSHDLALQVGAQVAAQVKTLSRRDILAASVANIRLIVTQDLPTAFAIANRYAAEHLIIQTASARNWLPEVHNAGAVFLGPWSPESVGDYCSGPNHTLPTYGYARAYSGLSLEDFQKRMSVQELTPQGLRNLGRTTEVLAGLEGLDAHAAAVTRRLQQLESATP
jgi:histidinol dehydrogenase